MMPPSKIMVIRHAEKPTGKDQNQGVREDGSVDPESLAVKGWQRAGALAVLFAREIDPRLPIPNIVFATALARHSESERPEETITPLCLRLKTAGHLTSTVFSHAKGEEVPLVADVIQRQGVVLICWQHEAIPSIANAILGNNKICPQSWPGGRFDIVWTFDRRADGTWLFGQVPQLLLAGDRDNVVS
jgi:hypothetical protein